jgi:hypothetical protein
MINYLNDHTLPTPHKEQQPKVVIFKKSLQLNAFIPNKFLNRLP